ncbi:MAG: MoxR family ATPase [Actinomycetota bacterium]|nr:MoxR family ATPase [Actinomycetota bacterium]MDQ6949363.1 MoxR family ATPase [Actinomycetota bacterium]
MITEPEAARFAQVAGRLADNIELVIRGKRDVIELALTCLFAAGHLLIEDVPGTGKTSLARCLAASLDASLQRIQFTPDLLPSDVTGMTIYNQGTKNFDFHRGPVFANLVLGDEINRASPKTQSALLEVMEEHQVTVDGKAHTVPRPFMVIATQNPVDMDGTYPLPEAQLDRFLIRTGVGYPDLDSELEVLETQRSGSTIDQLSSVVPGGTVQEMTAVATRVHIADALMRYLVTVVAATRKQTGVRIGASPRGSLALARAARAFAAAQGRRYVLPEDIKALAVPVLAHRLILTPEAEIKGRTAADLVEEALAATPVPTRRSA